jgi:1,4-alpha-glucan branching enzyme
MIEKLGDGWVRFAFAEAVDMSVFLVGDFNNWDEQSHPMELQDDGTYQAILKLGSGEFEFKYKCGNVWFNDRTAHKYVRNCWGSENSVVVVQEHEGSVGPRSGQRNAAAAG